MTRPRCSCPRACAVDHAARGRLVLLLAANGIIAPVITTSGLGRIATVRTVER